MRNKQVLACITIILLVLTAFLLGHTISAMNVLPISLSISNEDGEITISGWEKEEAWFFFLPSFADLSETRIRLETDTRVELDGSIIESGMSCSGLSLNQPYRITYSVWGKTYQKNLVLLRSSNLATVYLETQSGNMQYLHENKDNSESGNLRIFTDLGILECSSEMESISGRGSSSWTETEKKSYSINLSESKDLLGLGSAKRWILLANALDGSHLRNRIVYDMAHLMEMQYTVDSEWVDLYLNGEYAGLYLLSERNEVHPERVNIVPENSYLLSGELESRLRNQNIPYILTHAKQAMRIHYPQKINNDVLKQLGQQLQIVENAIQSDIDIDPGTGKKLEELIDIDSFVKRFLLDEVFGNIDGGALSQFYYYDGSDVNAKLYAGPAWDYDLSMGSAYMWQSQNPAAFYANRPGIKQGVDSTWIYALCQKEWFYNQAVELYQTVMLPLLETLFYEHIYLYEEKLECSALMNQIRWNLEGDLHSEITSLVTYMDQRLEFLDSIWLEDELYHCVTFIQGNGQNNAYYQIKSGENIQRLPPLKDTTDIHYEGWYSSDTNEPFDITKPITKDIEIYAKWVDTSKKRIDRTIKLIPLVVFAMIGVGLWTTDFSHRKNSGKWDS